MEVLNENMGLENQPTPQKRGNTKKIKVEEEPQDKEARTPTFEQANMEIDGHKEDLSIEDEFMRILTNEWEHLDKRFIPKDQKQLYKYTFQQHKAKQRMTTIDQQEHFRSQASQVLEQGSQANIGKK